MTQQLESMVGLFCVSSALGWAVWITLAVFDHKTKIALLEQEISVLTEVKDVLLKIETKLSSSAREPILS